MECSGGVMKLWRRRIVGVLTLGGGSIGVTAALPLLLARSNPIEWLFCTGFIVIYAWGVWCGVRLLENRPGAERSAAKYWLIQIPAFGSPILGYFLSNGFHATVVLQAFPFKIDGNVLLGSTFNYSLMQTGKPWFIGINLFAAVVAWWLTREASRNRP
jgi:hypothetical protein